MTKMNVKLFLALKMSNSTIQYTIMENTDTSKPDLYIENIISLIALVSALTSIDHVSPDSNKAHMFYKLNIFEYTSVSS